jgi:hypothetical protein
MALPQLYEYDNQKVNGTNRCAVDGCDCTDVELHHFEELRSRGGTKTVPLCRKHHREYHSQLGHFKTWGSYGGTKAQYGPNATFTRNLKQYRSK